MDYARTGWVAPAATRWNLSLVLARPDASKITAKGNAEANGNGVTLNTATFSLTRLSG